MNKHISELAKRSNNICSRDPLVMFVYELIRGYIPYGDIESIMIHIADKLDNKLTETMEYGNGWLALYAVDVAHRLKNIGVQAALEGEIIND